MICEESFWKILSSISLSVDLLHALMASSLETNRYPGNVRWIKPSDNGQFSGLPEPHSNQTSAYRGNNYLIYKLSLCPCFYMYWEFRIHCPIIMKYLHSSYIAHSFGLVNNSIFRITCVRRRYYYCLTCIWIIKHIGFWLAVLKIPHARAYCLSTKNDQNYHIQR